MEHTLQQRMKSWLSPLLKTPLHPQWLLYRAQKKAALSADEKKLSGTILDIGSGNRTQPEHFRQSEISYISLDYPVTMALGYQGTPHIFGDAHQLPIRDKIIDNVLLLDVLEHLRNPRQAMREACRVLKPDGTILLQTPFAYPLHDIPFDYQRWTEYGLKVLCTDQDLEIISLQGIGTAIESSAALLALNLARTAVESLARNLLFLPIFVIIAMLVPLINVFAATISLFLQHSAGMPLSYRVVAKKRSPQ